MNVEFHVDISGPISTGVAEQEMYLYARHIENVVGDIAVTAIQFLLPEQYMYLGHHGGTPATNPVPANAGALEAAIHTSRQPDNAVLVTDDPITYGPWIEGIDSKNLIVWPHHRNPPPRRFPGYHIFRTVTGILNRGQAGVIARRELPPFLTAMNG